MYGRTVVDENMVINTLSENRFIILLYPVSRMLAKSINKDHNGTKYG